MSIIMNEAGMGSLIPPFDSPFNFFEHQPPNMNNYSSQKQHYHFINMRRVVENQRDKFESDDLFKKLSRDNEQIEIISNKDQSMEVRKQSFPKNIEEGFLDIAFTCTGTNITVSFQSSGIDYTKEPGKVHLRSSPMIMNGVCIRWKGVVDLNRLEGYGSLQFDEEFARREDANQNPSYGHDSLQPKARDYSDKNRIHVRPYPTSHPSIKVERDSREFYSNL